MVVGCRVAQKKLLDKLLLLPLTFISFLHVFLHPTIHYDRDDDDECCNVIIIILIKPVMVASKGGTYFIITTKQSTVQYKP